MASPMTTDPQALVARADASYWSAVEYDQTNAIIACDDLRALTNLIEAQAQEITRLNQGLKAAQSARAAPLESDIILERTSG